MYIGVIMTDIFNNFLNLIVYQIYPRSFMDANGDGIGDIKGITQKLDYLCELGINAVWLSPCYKSPNCDNGYDISDYSDIMDEFGTLDDWKEMISEMHKRGIKLIMDFVANHTSIEHEWFKQARSSRQNPYHDYYIWRDDTKDGLCHCELCRKYNGADQNMLVMKYILKGIKQYDPQAKLSFLTYQDSFDVPLITPDKDMFLEFAPIERNHFVSIIGKDAQNEKNREILERLLKIFPAETAQALEYFLDVSLFCQWQREKAGPLQIDEKRLNADVAYYSSLGIKNISTFAAFMDCEWLQRYGTNAIETYGKIVNEIE